MPKTNLKSKPKAIIQKKRIYFTRKKQKSNSISKGKFIVSKDKEMQIELPNFNFKKTRKKSLLTNKRFRSREKSNKKTGKSIEKNEKFIEKSAKIRNKKLNESIKKNNIKNIKENEKINTKFLNKKRRNESIDYDEILQSENEKYPEEEQEKDEESIKSFSEARLEYLPCRKEEQDRIYNYIKKGLQTNGNYSSLYIAGMPGTGKTASVKTVVNILESELNDAKKRKNGKALGKDGIIPFNKLFISGIEYPNISNVFKKIYKFIFAKEKGKLNIKKYIHLLNDFFSHRKKFNSNSSLNDPSNCHILLIIDEIDILINSTQNLLYNIFNWTTYDYSKLIVISIANTLDLPNRLLPKIRSRMGNDVIMFRPYNKEELREIIKDRGIDLTLFSEDAIRLSCVKVAAINGDLRRIFQILTRAKQINSLKNYKKKNKESVSKFDILEAWDELFNSKVSKVIRSLNIFEKIIIATILSKIKEQNNIKINLGDLYDKKDIFVSKFNDSSTKEFEITWEEYKKIIYSLIRIKLLNYGDIPKSNFIENNIVIRFYVDEFIMACEGDNEFKPVMEYLTQIVNI